MPNYNHSTFSRLRSSFRATDGENSFIRSAVVLAGGTLFGQALVVLSSPLLTRLYSPQDFGALAVFTSILSILSVISSLRYEMAIPIPDDEATAGNMVFLSVFLVSIISAFTGIGAFLYGEQLTVLINAEVLNPYLWLIPLGVLTVGYYQVMNYWTTRRKKFSLLSYTKILQSSGQVGIQILGGWMRWGMLGLLTGQVMGRMLGTVSMLRKAQLPFRKFHFKTIQNAAYTYKKFPIYTVWAGLVNVLGTQAPPLLLTSFFSLQVVGWFSLTLRVLGLPSVLIGQAMGQVFYPMASERKNDPQGIKNFVEWVATLLMTISFPIFFFVFLFGPELFVWVFGNEWKAAGQFAQYLAPWLMLSLISSPLSTFVLIKGRQGQALLITLYETGLRIGLLLLGAFLHSPYLAIGLYSVAGTIISMIYIGWIMRLSGSGLIRWVYGIKNFLIMYLLLMAILIPMQYFINNPLVMIIISLSILIPLTFASFRQVAQQKI